MLKLQARANSKSITQMKEMHASFFFCKENNVSSLIFLKTGPTNNSHTPLH